MRLSVICMAIILSGCSGINSDHLSHGNADKHIKNDVLHQSDEIEDEANWFEDEYSGINENIVDKNTSNVQHRMLLADDVLIESDVLSNEIDFSLYTGDSLKIKLNEFLNQNNYTLLWKTDKNITFDGDVTFKGEDPLVILRSLSNELSEMGLDLHINVYKKNKVVLVYSVRA